MRHSMPSSLLPAPTTAVARGKCKVVHAVLHSITHVFFDLLSAKQDFLWENCTFLTLYVQ